MYVKQNKQNKQKNARQISDNYKNNININIIINKNKNNNIIFVFLFYLSYLFNKWYKIKKSKQKLSQNIT